MSSKPVSPVSLSITIPTIGRPCLAKLLEELVPQLDTGDEVMVIGDGSQPEAQAMVNLHCGRILYQEFHGGPSYWGHAQRNWAMPKMQGTHLWSLDDDDSVHRQAIEQIKCRIAKNPDRPSVFRMKHKGKVIWKKPEVVTGNISTQMMVVPNRKDLLGVWGSRYAGDFDFFRSTVDLYPGGDAAIVWGSEITILHGVDGQDPRPPPQVPTPKRAFERASRIDGWFAELEGLALSRLVLRAVEELPPPLRIVEIGSYLGRSTVIIASSLPAGAGLVHSIDPHEGVISRPDGPSQMKPTYDRFVDNLVKAEVDHLVRPIQARSEDVVWTAPIGFLFIDGLHDYDSVKHDFDKFAPHVISGGFVAFDDYHTDWPGVMRLVDEVRARPDYQGAEVAGRFAWLQKT